VIIAALLVMLVIIAAFWGVVAYGVLRCIGWASTPDEQPPSMFESLEPRTLASVTIAPYPGYPIHNPIMGPFAPVLEVGNKVKAPGQQNKQPPPSPPRRRRR
jgi:hypothetical protein